MKTKTDGFVNNDENGLESPLKLSTGRFRTISSTFFSPCINIILNLMMKFLLLMIFFKMMYFQESEK